MKTKGRGFHLSLNPSFYNFYNNTAIGFIQLQLTGYEITHNPPTQIIKQAQSETLKTYAHKEQFFVRNDEKFQTQALISHHFPTQT